MSRLSLLWFVLHSFAMPLADDDDDDNDNDDDNGCGSEPVVVTSTVGVHVPDGPSAAILAPYQHPPTPHPSPSQHLHATLPVSHQSETPAILGTMVGIVIALVAFSFTARYVVRRRRIVKDPFKDPPRSRFAAFWLRRSATAKKRLSDESWISPALPSIGSPVSSLLHDLELSRYAYPRRKLVPVTTPVCTPTDTEFGSRLGSSNGGPTITVPLVRVPSPVYISPFSPSPSLSSSSSSLSPTPSTEPPSSPSPNPARFSRLLSSTFRDTRVTTSPARPTTAHLIQTARPYANAYRPSIATTTSLHTPTTASTRFSGTRSRVSFYPSPTDDTRTAWARIRDTFSTVTTSDTDTDTVCTVPHSLRAMAEAQPSISPFADSGPETKQTRSVSPLTRTPVGTPLGLKLRLSDASEHARFRSRERERVRQREKEIERERAEQRFSTNSRTSEATEIMGDVDRQSRSEGVEAEKVRKEFKLRDSESVLREIGW